MEQKPVHLTSIHPSAEKVKPLTISGSRKASRAVIVFQRTATAGRERCGDSSIPWIPAALFLRLLRE